MRSLRLAVLSVVLGLGTSLAPVLGAAPAWAGTSAYNPSADATVKLAHPTVNYATENPLHLTNKSTNKQQAYLKFPVTLNPGDTVTSATLQLDFTQVQSSAVEIHSATSGWTETGITWNNQPGAGALQASKTVATGLQTFTIPASAIVNGDNTFEIQAPGYTGTSDYQFKSREDVTTSLRPLLTVVTTGGAQAPPAVTTGSASGVTSSAATLNGTVNPNGAATTCHFEYGTTTGYGTSTADDNSPGSGTTAVNVSANLTGLTASTLYHFRLDCTNSGGTSNGSDATFTTSAAAQAPAVITGAASSTGTTTATLNGSVNPEGQSATYQFDYGLTTSYGTSVPVPAGSAGSGSTAVNESYSLTGLTASTTYHYRIEATNATGTTLGSDQTFTTTAATTDLLASKLMLYGGQIGPWEGSTAPPFASATVISDETAAKPQQIRYGTYDCFTGQACGRDSHAGSISRTDFDSTLQTLTSSTGYNAALWYMLLPIAKGSVNNEPDGSQFCPPLSNFGMNLSMFESQLDEIKAAIGTSHPLILESSNEAEFDCWAYWATQDPTITGSGSVGVSKYIGDMYAATMPALVKYARDTLGFTQVISVGYVGISGGPGWGQACTQDGTGTWGWSCAYQPRWVNEFATEVYNSYTAHGNDPDYLPQVMSIHAYPHGSDFTSAAGYDFPDGEAYQYYRNWLVQSRARLDAIMGTTLGDSIRFAISEWNAGYSRGGTSDWAGWTTTGAPGAFYDGWYGMLRGDGNTQGAGTRYWAANLFDIASNSDTGTGKWYNYIHQDGTVPAWYANYKNASLNDPLR